MLDLKTSNKQQKAENRAAMGEGVSNPFNLIRAVLKQGEGEICN